MPESKIVCSAWFLFFTSPLSSFRVSTLFTCGPQRLSLEAWCCFYTIISSSKTHYLIAVTPLESGEHTAQMILQEA